jgi:hypothetical protein
MLPSTLPLEVKRVLQRATDEDPRNRYATVKGLLTAFTRAVEAFKLERTLLSGESSSDPTKQPSQKNSGLAKTGQLKKIVPTVLQSPYYSIIITVVFLAFIAWTIVPSLPATHFTRLGGVDLGTYCRSLHYEKNVADESCSSNIDLNKVCVWQYGSGHSGQFANPSDLTSGNCYDSKGVVVGGVDMGGYCKDPRQGYLGIPVASIVGNTWVCKQSINVTLACSWQYSRTDAQARKNDQNLWDCYGLW